MGIVNRRNAVLGWAVVKLGKRAAKKKAKDVVPDRDTGRRAPRWQQGSPRSSAR